MLRSRIERGRNVHNPDKLRELAAWYREYAERAEDPFVWDARLRTAENLEREAERFEQQIACPFLCTRATLH
jgi:hypothetical protein